MEPQSHAAPSASNGMIINTLVVDDDRSMRMMLQTQLEDLGHRVITADDGQSAWTVLQDDSVDIDIVVLDREMPGMNGLEVVAQMKNDPVLKNIPVIMQTGSDRAEQVREGINAGVHYYLTKPIDEAVLASVMSAAARNINQHKRLNQTLKHHQSSFNLIKKCQFTVRTVIEAENLACFLANFYPNPEKMIAGFTELFVNAVEHGNVGIDSEEKMWIVKNASWRNQISHRADFPEHRHKRVEVLYQHQQDGYYLTIKDCGKGIAWRKYLKVDPLCALENHGRGIAHVNSVIFDKISYNEAVNEVTTFVANNSGIDR